MAEQETTSENKLGQNWRTVAIVAVILMVGAVMGHSMLSGDRAASTGEAGQSACSTCPNSASCSEKADASQPACCASKTADSGSVEEAACATKAACCSGAEEATEKPAGCSGGAGCSKTEKGAETPSACGGCQGSACSKAK